MKKFYPNFGHTVPISLVFFFMIFLASCKDNDQKMESEEENEPFMMESMEFWTASRSYPNKELEADWKQLGADKFAFEVLEEIVARDDMNYDYKADLETLEDLWLEKLEPYGERGYNERKKTREERLRMIAANRKL